MRTRALFVAAVLALALISLRASADTGDHIWSADFGDDGIQRANDVASDDAGNTIVVGTFADTIDFGGATLASAG
jgi:hypothetical protein